MSENKQKILPSPIALPLERQVLEEVVDKAKDYALMHGICMRNRANFNPDTLQVWAVQKKYELFILSKNSRSVYFFLVRSIHSHAAAIST